MINFDVPEDQDGYVHRTGRTGRAGRDGVAITFVLADQAREMGTIAKRLGLEFPPHTSAENGHAPARAELATAAASATTAASARAGRDPGPPEGRPWGVPSGKDQGRTRDGT